MHTIKLLLTYYLNISVQAANLSDCRIESNRKNHPFAQKLPHRRICTKFGAAVGAADVITCTKFFGDRSRDVYSVGGQKLPSPIDKNSRR